MARKLHDRLALASYKTRHGQENLCFRDVEACLPTMQRKRRISYLDTSSVCSSSDSSTEHRFMANGISSSPPTGPVLSDDIEPSSFLHTSQKRTGEQILYTGMDMPKRKRARSYSMAPPQIDATRSSWKASYNLPHSSPIHHHGPRFSTARGPSISFASEIPTIPNSPTFGHVSEEEEEDGIPRQSHHQSQSNARPSPPRTPPPTYHRTSKSHGNGEEGADLLLYLATSPSPANPGARTTRLFAPSTPPSKDRYAFGGVFGTPGMTGFNTPGQQFNFADFVNITPSPAQGAFGNRTPGPNKTPSATRDARRRLNFDALIPPGGSPTLSNVGRGSSKEGLGMELGGELTS